jgi:hypothetical protein
MRHGLATVLFIAAVLTCSRADAQFAARRPAPQLPQGEDFHVELGLMFWTPTPDLVIGSDSFAVIGSPTIDFVQEFAIDNERFREFRLVAKPGRKHKLRFSYVPVTYENSTPIQRTVVIGGRPVAVNTTVNSDVDWKIWRYGYEWDFVARSGGIVGLIAELKYNKVTAVLSSPDTNVTATADATAPVPTLGVIGRGYLAKAFSITGEFTAFKIPESWSETFNAKFYDFDLYGTLNFGRSAAAQFGYRSIVTQYLVDDDSGDLKLKGLYFGGMVRF